MVERKNVELIAFVGLSGTGRSAAAKYLSDQGIPKVSFSDIISRALQEENLEWSIENERAVREKLRLDPSGDIVATRVIDQINNLINAGQRRIIVDGLGSWETYKRLKHEFPGCLTIVALTARRTIRHRRLAQRADRPFTEPISNERDYDAIEILNKGGIIAVADYHLTDNHSLEQLHMQIDELLREIEF